MAAVLAAIGGILLATQLGSGEPTAGDGYLLDAFAATFLGTGFYAASCWRAACECFRTR